MDRCILWADTSRTSSHRGRARTTPVAKVVEPQRVHAYSVLDRDVKALHLGAVAPLGHDAPVVAAKSVNS